MITFSVDGAPATKGSTKSFAFKRANGSLGTRTTNDNAKTKQWELHVRAAASALQQPCLARPAGVRLALVFRLARPAGLAKRQLHATKKPDIDKLARAALDALIGVLVEDDAQVVFLSVQKRYALPGEAWGVSIALAEVV